MVSFNDVIARVSDALRGVPCIDAIVLGGSHATGSATVHSDIDIGIYYSVMQEIDVVQLNGVAQRLDDLHRPHLVTSPGGWGPWVNAGAWMRVDGYHVDFILRDSTRVTKVMLACESGQVEAHYQPGHPHAFINVMYMGELAVSRLLWDASGNISGLKQRAERYPDAVQHALYASFGFEAQFSADLAKKTLERQDPYYLMAHIVRSISSLNQVIFAVNRQYCLNEKNAVARANSLALHPDEYQARVESVMRNAGSNPYQACTDLQRLIDETQKLVETL